MLSNCSVMRSLDGFSKGKIGSLNSFPLLASEISMFGFGQAQNRGKTEFECFFLLRVNSWKSGNLRLQRRKSFFLFTEISKRTRNSMGFSPKIIGTWNEPDQRIELQSSTNVSQISLQLNAFNWKVLNCTPTILIFFNFFFSCDLFYIISNATWPGTVPK